MEIKLGNTKCILSFGFFAVLGLYLLLDQMGLGTTALAVIALHEAGHIFAMKWVGAKITAMEFHPFGVRLERRGNLTIGQEVLVYLGGVGMNALCLLVCVPWMGWNLFTMVNAVFLVFNLLPVGRLDGGVLLRLMLCRTAPVKAGWIQKTVGLLVLIPMYAGGFLLAVKGNYTLLVTAGYLSLNLWGTDS